MIVNGNILATSDWMGAGMLELGSVHRTDAYNTLMVTLVDNA